MSSGHVTRAPDRRARRAGHRRAGFWIRLCVVLIKPVNNAVFRLDYRGLDNVPPTGGVILAANHVSYADPFHFVHFAWESGRIPRTLAKESLFDLPVAGRILRGTKQIPVQRGTTSAHSSLDGAIASLRAGEAVLIYPEGTITRDPDGWPMVGRTGVARLALASGAPVVPIAQWGAREFYDRYAGRLRPLPRKRIDWLAGPQVDLTAYEGKPLTAALLRAATDTIMTAIRGQLGVIRSEAPPVEFFPQPVRRGPEEGGTDR